MSADYYDTVGVDYTVQTCFQSATAKKKKKRHIRLTFLVFEVYRKTRSTLRKLWLVKDNADQRGDPGSRQS